MPREITTRHRLSFGWLRGEDWWGDPVSDNFVRLDMLLNTYVLSITTNIPPLLAAPGDMYIIPAGALDEWAGHENELAVFTPDGWIFCTPTKGVRARLADPASWIWFNGVAWLDEGATATDGPPPLGTRYDISVFVGYEAEPTEVIMGFTIPEAMTLPKAMVGSLGRAVAAPSGIVILSVRKNGSAIGTITFAPSSLYASFQLLNNTLFGKGDFLSVHMPDTMPSGFQNYSATLRFILANNGE